MDHENEGTSCKERGHCVDSADCIDRRLEAISATLDCAETFLASCSFVYDFNNIKILSETRICDFPEPWLAHVTNIRAEDAAFASVKASIANPDKLHDNFPAPEDFLKFCRKRSELLSLFQELLSNDTTSSEPAGPPLPLPCSLERGMTQKKAHEVARMARFVGNACKENGVIHVIDVGSGVGHLGRVLNEVYGLRVSCLEGDAQIAEAAERRRRRGHVENVAYFNLRIGRDSAGELENVAKSGGDGDRVALVGLHCCGDLSSDIINLFLSVPCISLLALVPCCFHKASPSNASVRSMSRVAKSPFMRRLAVQDSYSKWEGQTEAEHERHMRVFGYRAILEDFVRRKSISLEKRRRRGRRTDSTATFKSWFAENFVITGEYDEGELANYVEENMEKLPVLEFVTGLQQSLQDLVLSHLVMDRVEFLLRHSSVKDARAYELFDADISSVNKLLFSTKYDCDIE